jgi:hypothetical protein
MKNLARIKTNNDEERKDKELSKSNKSQKGESVLQNL